MSTSRGNSNYKHRLGFGVKPHVLGHGESFASGNVHPTVEISLIKNIDFPP